MFNTTDPKRMHRNQKLLWFWYLRNTTASPGTVPKADLDLD